MSAVVSINVRLEQTHSARVQLAGSTGAVQLNAKAQTLRLVLGDFMKGDKGDKGERGEKGERGDAGSGIMCWSSVNW